MITPTNKIPIPSLFQNGLSEFISIIGANSAIKRTATNKIVITNQAYALFLRAHGNRLLPFPFSNRKNLGGAIKQQAKPPLLGIYDRADLFWQRSVKFGKTWLKPVRIGSHWLFWGDIKGNRYSWGFHT
jgi:hypothetical protein